MFSTKSWTLSLLFWHVISLGSSRFNFPLIFFSVSYFFIFCSLPWIFIVFSCPVRVYSVRIWPFMPESQGSLHYGMQFQSLYDKKVWFCMELKLLSAIQIWDCLARTKAQHNVIHVFDTKSTPFLLQSIPLFGKIGHTCSTENHIWILKIKHCFIQCCSVFRL